MHLIIAIIIVAREVSKFAIIRITSVWPSRLLKCDGKLFQKWHRHKLESECRCSMQNASWPHLVLYLKFIGPRACPSEGLYQLPQAEMRCVYVFSPSVHCRHFLHLIVHGYINSKCVVKEETVRKRAHITPPPDYRALRMNLSSKNEISLATKSNIARAVCWSLSVPVLPGHPCDGLGLCVENMALVVAKVNTVSDFVYSRERQLVVQRLDHLDVVIYIYIFFFCSGHQWTDLYLDEQGSIYQPLYLCNGCVMLSLLKLICFCYIRVISYWLSPENRSSIQRRIFT